MKKSAVITELPAKPASDDADISFAKLRERLRNGDDSPVEASEPEVDLYRNALIQRERERQKKEESILKEIGDNAVEVPSVAKTNNRSDLSKIASQFKENYLTSKDDLSSVIDNSSSKSLGLAQVYSHVYSDLMNEDKEKLGLSQLVLSESNKLAALKYINAAKDSISRNSAIPLLVISSRTKGIGRKTILTAIAKELELKVREFKSEDGKGIQRKGKVHEDLASYEPMTEPKTDAREIIIFHDSEMAVNFCKSGHSKAAVVLFAAPPTKGGNFSLFGVTPVSEDWDGDPLRYISSQHFFLRLRSDEFEDRESFDKLIHSILNQNSFKGDLQKVSRRHFNRANVEPKPSDIFKAIIQAKNKAEAESRPFDNLVLTEVLQNLSLRSLDRKIELSELDKKHTAYHEAGHALVHHFVAKKGVASVSIIPEGGSLGRMELDDKPVYGLSTEEAHSFMQTLLAGRVAEKLFFNRYSSGASDDLRRAYGLSRTMIMEWGMSEKAGPMGLDQRAVGLLSEKTRQLIDEESSELVRKAEKDCMEFLDKNRETLERVANRLLETGEIEAEEFLSLCISKEAA